MNTKNNPDNISYRLLDELTKESTISQRALADRLGIALGLVNAYIKRMYHKGYIKIKTLPRNRIKYILTPQGLAEKSRLTYKYMHYSIIYFSDVRQKIESTYAALTRAGVAKVLLWGDGELAELCYISTRGYPIEIVGVVGKKAIKNGFFHFHVYAPEDIHEVVFDAVLVSALDEKARKGVEKSGIPGDKIVFLEQEQTHVTRHAE